MAQSSRGPRRLYRNKMVDERGLTEAPVVGEDRVRDSGGGEKSSYNRQMAWRIEKQANGKFAIYSTRLDDYVLIDADPLDVAQIYAEKGVRVYLASARMQLARETPVSTSGEAKIAASRERGSVPREDPSTPIGVTGFPLGDLGEE